MLVLFTTIGTFVFVGLIFVLIFVIAEKKKQKKRLKAVALIEKLNRDYKSYSSRLSKIMNKIRYEIRTSGNGNGQNGSYKFTQEERAELKRYLSSEDLQILENKNIYGQITMMSRLIITVKQKYMKKLKYLNDVANL